ncbi:hypothetical protein H8356DRAFT_937085 [Neocallimastix lanati (nom. inval.)]|nr:hypothetical protein H8356DRAFT_937085 [Neocallimastix sp. JGI-2020a]
MFDTAIKTSDDTYETLDLNKNILDKEESQDIIYYDTEAIKSETKWKKVNIQTDSYNHLSLVSQFKYDKNIINSYDNNYYFSEKAGEGTDIFIIDDGINTMHVNFQNQKGYHINKRTVKCDAIIINAKVEEIDENDERSKLCTVNHNGEMPKHRTYVTTVAGGFYFGVAKKANIHVIASDMTIGSVIKALEYIKNLSERSTNYINPHKTIIIISHGTYDIHEYTDLKNYLNKIIDLGFIVIAGAGNNNVDADEDNNGNDGGDDEEEGDGNKCKNISKSQNWKFSIEFNKIGNDENNSNIRNYVSLDAKKSWIYNSETKLCLYWNDSSSISKPYLKECSNSNNNLWYISNNLSYFVSYKDSFFCLFVNTSGNVTIKKCEYDASLLIYSKNKIKYSDLNNIDKCLGIQNYNNMNKENITVTMNKCNNDNKDQNWIISSEFPSNL